MERWWRADFPLVLGHGLSLQGVEMVRQRAGAAYTRALRGKERAAPMDSPKARKKVIRAPAVSASLGFTSLTGQGNRDERVCV